MPTIFDNIENVLKEGLNRTLEKSKRADFCIGYFNLRGWKQVAAQIVNLKSDDGNCCRLLIGMQKPPLENSFLTGRFIWSVTVTDDAMEMKKIIFFTTENCFQ